MKPNLDYHKGFHRAAGLASAIVFTCQVLPLFRNALSAWLDSPKLTHADRVKAIEDTGHKLTDAESDRLWKAYHGRDERILEAISMYGNLDLEVFNSLPLSVRETIRELEGKKLDADAKRERTKSLISTSCQVIVFTVLPWLIFFAGAWLAKGFFVTHGDKHAGSGS